MQQFSWNIVEHNVYKISTIRARCWFWPRGRRSNQARDWHPIDLGAGIEACRRSCWLGLCGGGAPANKLYELGGVDGAETMACRLTRKGILDVVLKQLESELKWRVGEGKDTRSRASHRALRLSSSLPLRLRAPIPSTSGVHGQL